MKACDTCSTLFETDLSTCPNCRKKIGGFLSRSMTGHMDAEQMADLVLKRMRSKWGLNSFASGWRLLDIGIRVVLIAVLVSLAISTWTEVEGKHHEGRQQLASHHEFVIQTLKENRPMTKEEVAFYSTNYMRLSSSASDMIEALRINGMVHVFILLMFVGLLSSQVIGRYRGHKEYNRLKATLAFVMTPEGQAWAGRNMAAPEEPKAAEVPAARETGK